MRVFVPFTDSMLEQLGPKDRLVPYQVGLGLFTVTPEQNQNEPIMPGKAAFNENGNQKSAANRMRRSG